ncbi:hypothetical protein [Streptomyces aidingensis]|uniref:DNA-directed RNA polymerase specialized sigma subunit, sigma24 family n=1 Tax=Streptomyces aidingensis TaxID=910347 RepID=A0A1I1LJ88_9ACTN|nr:hypothetical protein [Streptomyces aidingensis]SFC70403.1 hypothetical protein SAMN05421773_105141 [Streptomyces aidingensis]
MAAAVDVEQAEAAIAEHYPRLVRLGYLVLPPSLGRHRRVLTAHGLAQRALPRGRRRRRASGVPVQRGSGQPGTDPGYVYVRQQVLRGALAAGRPFPFGGLGIGRLHRPAPLLPQVWGLRVFPPSGGSEELTTERALAAASAQTRAAWALARLENLPDPAVRELLCGAGLTESEARGAVQAAQRLPAGEVPDPCSLRARPADLLRRRQFTRGGLVVGATLLALLAGMVLARPDGAGGETAAELAADPALLARAEPAAWQDAARLDFSVWPARGPAAEDTELLGRALDAWSAPGGNVQVSATPGSHTGPPPGSPQLLYAGTQDGVSLVLLHDGHRLVRYAEAGGAAALDFARTDGAQAAGASAVVLHRGEGTVQYLLAPWVTGAALGDLTAPDTEAEPLEVDRDGVAAPMATPAGRQECTDFPVLELVTDPAARVASGGGSGGSGAPPLVLADLGELTPALLTYGSPRTGPGQPLPEDGREVWARTACHLPSVAGGGVREVNSWEFARQPLPDGGGTASWVCTRAETWRGAGSQAMTQFQAPPGGEVAAGSPGAVTGRAESTAACGPRAPEVLGGVLWRSPESAWFVLAAGSEGVTAIRAEGEVTGGTGPAGEADGAPAEAGRRLVLPAQEGAAVELTAELADGGTLEVLK